MATSRPHPYTLEALYSSENNNPGIHVSIGHIPRDTRTFNHNGARPLINAINPHPCPRKAPSRHHRPLLPLRLRPVVFLFIFLPVPSLLSLSHMTLGHAILRQIHRTPSTSIYHTPVFSSTEAGATGGLILSLPFVLLLYLLMFPRQPSIPDDFFEDDDSITPSSARWMMYIGYAVCIFFLIGIGGVAGPLGVICLSGGTLDAFVVMKTMLSTRAAAAAGFLGGIVLSFGILLNGVVAALVRFFWIRRHWLFP